MGSRAPATASIVARLFVSLQRREFVIVQFNYSVDSGSDVRACTLQMLGYRQQSPRLGADRHRWRRLWPVVVAMMMMTSPVLPYHGFMLSRFIGQDLLSPALLAAEALITPVHVHVLVRTELPPAQEAGPR